MRAKKFKVFDPDYYLHKGAAVTGHHAVEIADLSDEMLNQASWVMYGKHRDGVYFDFSSFQKDDDTVAVLCYLAKTLRAYHEKVSGA